MKDRWLRALGIVLLYVGIGYALGGRIRNGLVFDHLATAIPKESYLWVFWVLASGPVEPFEFPRDGFVPLSVARNLAPL